MCQKAGKNEKREDDRDFDELGGLKKMKRIKNRAERKGVHEYAHRRPFVTPKNLL